MKKRSEIAEQYKWDLSGYYSSDEAWENDFNYIKNNYIKVKQFENKLNTKQNIYDYFIFEENISKITDKLGAYASLKVQEDSLNDFNQTRLNKLEKLASKMSVDSAFAGVELSELSDEFLTELSQDKDFKNYDLTFKDIIKNKKHMLSKKEEKLLAGTGEFADQFSDIFDMFDSADVKFADVLDQDGNLREMNNSIYHLYITSKDRVLRKNAYECMNNTYGKINHMLASNYIGHVKSDCFYGKIRNFESAIASSMYAEDVSENVYNTLVKSVNDNISKFHRFFEIKRKLLNLPQLAIYDVNAEIAECQKHYTYEEAIEIVRDAVSVLGDDYSNLITVAYKDRWIDVFANEGKNTGAFSSGIYEHNPVVLTNFEGTTNCVFTIAHELGHSLHTYFSNKNQPYEKAGYEIFVAEVASTVNEMLLLRYFLNNSTSKEDKIFYYNYLMKMFNSTIFRQTMFAEFEQQAHAVYENDGQLTADFLNKYYYDLNKKYFGEKVELLPAIQYEWSRIPHFYSSFYVYKYATGLISAFFIANKILSGEENAVSNYKKFLSSGCTDNPVELLKIAGVDLTKQSTFDCVFNEIDILLNEFEQIINN